MDVRPDRPLAVSSSFSRTAKQKSHLITCYRLEKEIVYTLEHPQRLGPNGGLEPFGIRSGWSYPKFLFRKAFSIWNPRKTGFKSASFETEILKIGSEQDKFHL
jgi:hypothetical protein